MNSVRMHSHRIGISCTFFKLNTDVNRTEITRHDNVCYHVTDIPEDLSVNKTGDEYVVELSQKIVTHIEDILGYVFRSKQRKPHIGMGNENSGDQIDGDTNIHQSGCHQMLFRCSQDRASASYSKRTSKKRRRRKRE